jgi:hypothetical protein
MAATVLKPDQRHALSLGIIFKIGLVGYRSQSNIPLLETTSISFG